MSKFSRTIRFSLLLVGLAAILNASPTYAADGNHTYRDREYGFSFDYPASWSAQPGISPNTRVAVTAPADQPGAVCNILVRHVPAFANKTQVELNRGLDGKEFEYDYWLRDMPKNIRVFDPRKHYLGQQVARSAILQYSLVVQGVTLHATQLHLVTLQPGLFFGFTCGSTGDTVAEAAAGFTFWKQTFSKIILSLKFKEPNR